MAASMISALKLVNAYISFLRILRVGCDFMDSVKVCGCYIRHARYDTLVSEYLCEQLKLYTRH